VTLSKPARSCGNGMKKKKHEKKKKKKDGQSAPVVQVFES
jgi:hypothetical protein